MIIIYVRIIYIVWVAEWYKVVGLNPISITALSQGYACRFGNRLWFLNPQLLYPTRFNLCTVNAATTANKNINCIKWMAAKTE